jgi:trigger factor
MLHEKAIKAINKEVSLPGFRKGKAPKELIMKNYAPHVDKEWKEQLLQTSFNEAIKLTNLYPFNKNSVKNAQTQKISLNEESVISVTFESSPNVPNVDIKEIEFEQVPVEPIQEGKVNQIIEDIRYQFAEWEPITGRAVEAGDFVDVDIENLDTPGEFVCRDTRIEVKEGKIGKWLINLLVGMNVGESKDAVSEQEPGQNHPNFRPTHCRVTVNEIQGSTLPEVNDELAVKAGVASVAELRAKIEQNLQSAQEQEALKKKRTLIEKAIISKYSFDIPESLVVDRVQHILASKKAQLEGNGDADAANLESTLKQAEEEAFKEVRDSYQWYFLARQVANEQSIDVPHEEVVSEIIRQRYTDPEAAALFNHAAPEEVYSYIFSKMVSAKVADYFIKAKENSK